MTNLRAEVKDGDDGSLNRGAVQARTRGGTARLGAADRSGLQPGQVKTGGDDDDGTDGDDADDDDATDDDGADDDDYMESRP